MKTSLMLLAGLILSPSILLGQQAASTSVGVAGMQSQAAAQVIILQTQPCPVSLQAKQSGMTDMIKVKNGPDAQPEVPKPSQHIHLIVSRIPGNPNITGATITVRGLSARGRAQNALAGGESSDLRRTLNITFTAHDDKSLSAELVLPGFTTVRSIRLEAFAYRDGTTRDLPAHNGCSVAPDPLMLVADR